MAMLAKRPAGRHAAAIKYDVLTAMGAYALAQGPTSQRLVLRLLTLLTARYNWQRDELAVGQREIARLWDVDERTVKREMAKLRSMGWLVIKRQGARGRVSQYGLGLDRILDDTRDRWAAVGPDFDCRMSGGDEQPTNVVPLRSDASAPAPDLSDGTEWSLAKGLLHTEDMATYTAWIQALTRESRAGGRLVLRAPSRFHATYVMSHLKRRLLTACRDVDSDITDITVVS
jgi:DNA-binding transcriptional MocR family regulator